MKTYPTAHFENRLKTTGTTLRERPSIVGRVMEEIRRATTKSSASQTARR